MTNPEFSDSFSTLLNSYASQAQFGEEASKREIVLDEYEKSVYLTQAQDIIVKSYFDATLNAQGQGFDDSTRRQVDFSSLIKVATLDPIDNIAEDDKFDDRGIIYRLPGRPKKTSESTSNTTSDTTTSNSTTDTSEEEGTTDVLFILNEKLIVSKENKNKEYVIVPINYREYDREMSKPYAQPLKKQAWRLFHNTSTGFDIQTELIPRVNIKQENGTTFTYKIRYVRRPQPIILETLPDGLEIDGIRKETPCELHPILHADILSKAVELAVATRAGSIPQAPQQGAVRRQREE